MAQNNTTTNSCVQSTLDSLVDYCCHHGLTQSIIVHSLLLIWLAFLFPVTQSRSDSVKLTVCFSARDNVLDETPVHIDFQQATETPPEPAGALDEVTHTSVGEPAPGSDILTSDEPDLVEVPALDVIQASYEISEVADLDVLSQEIRSTDPVQRPRRPNMPQQGSGVAEATSDRGNNGSDEIQGRLKEYGARTGDIQISLAWDTIDDLDLYVAVNPVGSHINWQNRFGQCGGMLDIDMNAHPGRLTNRPVENIFWPQFGAPMGEYTVGVHFYANWSGNHETKATLMIKTNEKTETIPVVVRYAGGHFVHLLGETAVDPVATFRFPK